MGCQKCLELEARVAYLESQLTKQNNNNNNSEAGNMEVAKPEYYNKVLELLRDPNLKPSDLSQIDIPTLIFCDLKPFVQELLVIQPSNRSIGLVIFLKHKSADFAVQLGREMYARTREKMIRDSLEKLFPQKMPQLPPLPTAPIVKEQPKETLVVPAQTPLTRENSNDKLSTEEIITKMKSLLETLLEQAYSDDVDPALYGHIRAFAMKAGPTDTYEYFIRRDVWPQFPTNLESKFSRTAFLSLVRLLQELLDIFPPEIQSILQQKLNLIQVE